MPKTVVGMFDTFGEAQSAVQDLVQFGVRREDISLVARDEHGTRGEAHEVGGATAEGAGAGAVGGSVVGGALGLLIGAGLLVIPGIGPVLAAGPLAAAVGSAAATIGATALGAGLGAAAGGLLGSLMGAGVAEEDAHAYVEGVRRGGTLVSVAAAEAEVDDVRQIMIRNGAIDMDTRAAEWRSSGWDATGTGGFAAGNVSMGSAAIDSTSDAYTTGVADTSIPRGDAHSIRGRDYSGTGEAGADTIGAQAGAERDAAGEDWQDSSKLGTVGGTLAGAATGAAVGAAGGPVGAVVGGVAGAATGAGVGAAGDVAGERAEPAVGDRDRQGGPGAYDFRDDENLADADRKVVDSSFTDVDRTGERVKGPAGYKSGHDQPFAGDPAQFDEFATYREGNFRSDASATGDPRQDELPSTDAANRGAGFGELGGVGAAGASRRPHADEGLMSDPLLRDDRMVPDTPPSTRPLASDADTLSESTRRAPHFAGADDMGGAMSGMQGGSGSEQPGAFASTPGRSLSSDQRASLMGDERNAGAATSDQMMGGGPRIYDRPDRDDARAEVDATTPAHGDFARGMREDVAPAAEPDYARGLHDDETGAAHTHDPAHTHVHEDSHPAAPHHGDFARGMREEAEPVQPDYARGQRGYEVYDTDFINHYQSLTGSGGQPYDYYKPGYQFGYDMASDRSFSHDSWEAAERDARQRWESEARGSWEEFKQTIRYGWEKARGRA